MKGLKVMKNNIRQIAYDAMFLAIILVMTFTPYVGYIQIGPISFTLIHLPVLIGAALFGWKRGLLYGLFFGAGSLIKAMTMPGTIDFLFFNPLVSILPRMIFGLLAGLLFSLLRKFKAFYQKGIVMPIGAFLLTVIHTFLVLTVLFLIYRIELNEFLQSDIQYIGFALGGLITLGAIVEAALAFIIVPLIVLPIMHKTNLNNQIVKGEQNEEN